MKKIFSSILLGLVFILFSACSGLEYSLDTSIPADSDTKNIENDTHETNYEEQNSDLQPESTSTQEQESPVLEETQNEEQNNEALVQEITTEDVVCMEVYNPVCGMISMNCEEENCPLVPQTFSNSCFAEKANAQDIKEGACE